MLKCSNKDIEQVYYGSKTVTAIYRGTKMVWEAVRSCFGSGAWINVKGWINTESWKN
jgi:hypothetical protein